MSGKPIPPRLQRDLADTNLDPDCCAGKPPEDHRHSPHELYRRVALLECQVAGLQDDVGYWRDRANLYKALWTSLPRRLRRWAFRRYDRAHPLGLERLR
jgi:hypothetical protein